MEKKKKLVKVFRATEGQTEARAILIGMPRGHLADVAFHFAMISHQTISAEDQFKLQFLELPRYDYGSQSAPSLVSGPGVDLTAVLPIEILMKVIEYIPPIECLRLSESNKFFHQILEEESFWNVYCERLLNSAFKKEYSKILERNTLSSKRLALLIFGKRDPISLYSDWESYQRLERSKHDTEVAKEIKKEIKKGTFQKIVRFDTFNAHDFEIRLTDHNYVNLLEYDWQIQDDQGTKGYFERCADSIKKFYEREIEEKKKLVPKKKQKLVSVESTILFVGFDLFQHFQQKIARGGAYQFTTIEQVTAYFNTLLNDPAHPPGLQHLLPLDAPMVRSVYEALVDNIYFSTMLCQ